MYDSKLMPYSCFFDWGKQYKHTPKSGLEKGNKIKMSPKLKKKIKITMDLNYTKITHTKTLKLKGSH